MRKVRQFAPGDKVFAKVKGYPAWPARVDGEAGKKFKVHFYGTGETGLVKVEDLFPYLEHKSQFVKPLKRKDYNDALEEIEAAVRQDVENANAEPASRGQKRKLSSDGEQRTLGATPEGEPQSKRNLRTSPVRQSSPVPVVMAATAAAKDSPEPEPAAAGQREPADAEPETFTVVTAAQLEARLGRADAPEPGPGEVLLAHVEYGRYVGVRLGLGRPPSPAAPAERQAWQRRDAQAALALKAQLEAEDGGEQEPEEGRVVRPPRLQLTAAQLAQATEHRIIERKKDKLRWLKVESSLVELDALIKTSLGLDRADPRQALAHLDAMLQLHVDPLMLKKHPHVLDMVKRLKRYIGNVKEWKLAGRALTDFQHDAERIRARADLVYAKFRALFGAADGRQFWDAFLAHVNAFKALTRDLPESHVFGLCAEPGSRQALWDQLDEREELAIMAAKAASAPDAPH